MPRQHRLSRVIRQTCVRRTLIATSSPPSSTTASAGPTAEPRARLATASSTTAKNPSNANQTSSTLVR